MACTKHRTPHRYSEIATVQDFGLRCSVLLSRSAEIAALLTFLYRAFIQTHIRTHTHSHRETVWAKRLVSLSGREYGEQNVHHNTNITTAWAFTASYDGGA